MILSSRTRLTLGLITLVAIVLAILALLYVGTTPTRYRLLPQDVSPVDIYAPRSIPDEEATIRLAEGARAATADIMVRSSSAAANVINRVSKAFEIISVIRQDAAAEHPTTPQNPGVTPPSAAQPSAYPTSPAQNGSSIPGMTSGFGLTTVDPLSPAGTPAGLAGSVGTTNDPAGSTGTIADSAGSIGTTADPAGTVGTTADPAATTTTAPSPTTPTTASGATVQPIDPGAPADPEDPDGVTQKSKQMVRLFNSELRIVLSEEDAVSLTTLEPSRYDRLVGHVRNLAGLIMLESVDSSALTRSLDAKMATLEQNVEFYAQDIVLIRHLLDRLLEPNVYFDQRATEKARQAAYDNAIRNPRLINRGTRIVSAGEIVQDSDYAVLVSLDLIDRVGFDVIRFAGLLVYLMIILGIAVFYLQHYERENIAHLRDLLAVAMAWLIPVAAAAYFSRQAPLTPPVYFAAVLISAYFGFRAGAVLSIALACLVMPMTGFDSTFLIVAVLGCIVAALFVQGIVRKDSYAFIILATAAVNFTATFALAAIQKDLWSQALLNGAYTAFSGGISVIAAIGVMPLFELLFNAVSPLRLIELSQPGHPLLRRLFLEAPGSSQHSMMVANLADAAATAIGANAMIARVGAYYHDIGKLENPDMFTENQEGVNPHDGMEPQKSAQIITSHPDAGVRLGRRYRLPLPILRIIHEHHGTTATAYFLHKARQIAEGKEGKEPDPDQFKYQAPLPSSRESAVVMLADSVEAAMRSTRTGNLADAAVLIRRIIKQKVEMDQLLQSGLSFRDVELIIQAFLQVYTGHLHERIKYPDDLANRKPAT